VVNYTEEVKIIKARSYLMQIILAKNKLNYIGLHNDLPWRSSEDLKHFKRLTSGKKLLVGRTTYENLPKLRDREFLVVGTGYYTLEEALQLKPDYCIGGKKLIESVWENHKDLITEVHLSIIDDYTIGDCRLDIDFTNSNIKVNIYNFNTN
jgi:dihydrofolate reductase